MKTGAALVRDAARYDLLCFHFRYILQQQYTRQNEKISDCRQFAKDGGQQQR